jgi:hypothetical protein
MPTSTHEEIKVGEVAIRFLVEAEQSAGSVAVFEFDVPAGAKVPVAHSHDGYEETIYGLEAVTSTPRRSRSSPPASSAPTTSAKSRPSSTPRPEVRRISRQWQE